MRKSIIVAASFAALVVPSAAMAAAPDGTYTLKQGANGNASSIGAKSSAITQNGQFVSGNGDNLLSPTRRPRPARVPRSSSSPSATKSQEEPGFGRALFFGKGRRGAPLSYDFPLNHPVCGVEPRGIEPLTFWLPARRSPS